MSKWFQAEIVTTQHIMIEVADDKDYDEALLFAEDFRPFEGDTEITIKDVPEKHVESNIRHADEVVFIKDYETEE